MRPDDQDLLPFLQALRTDLSKANDGIGAAVIEQTLHQLNNLRLLVAARDAEINELKVKLDDMPPGAQFDHATLAPPLDKKMEICPHCARRREPLNN